jgi:SAM-dependent methyltransferase
MEAPGHVIPNFPADAFAGTSSYYLRFRPPYPRALLDDLVARSRATGTGLMVDLACGPGRVAFGLLASFGEVLAVDLEPEMVDEGRREAARLGLSKITWRVGKAEDTSVPGGAAELVTIGEAFHRLDQVAVSRAAFGWLRPGGCLVTLGSFSVLSGREPWQRSVVECVQRWTAGRSGTSDGLPPRKPGAAPEQNEFVLRRAGFEEVASYTFPATVDWTLDGIIGYLYSTSACSKALLGRDAGAFEAEIRAVLLSHDPSGVYAEDPQWGYTLGRRPF